MKRIFTFLVMMVLFVGHSSAVSSADVSPSLTVAENTAFEAAPAQTLINATADNELEEYTGQLYHVFYHFLIAFPEIAAQDAYGASLKNDCVTPTEFRRSLEELYNNDFVLVDINNYLSYDEAGTAQLAPITVPKGKEPLVMSFDDINYYALNHGKGICDKIILDDESNFAMLTLHDDGAELITYDNGVVPILEQFCNEHPDFSPSGDKGILAITGYDGILGYRIQRDSENREAEIEAVTPVVEALKSSGWTFASHSYGHIHSRSIGLEQLKTDTEHWENEIASIVGDTQIYVFPYGEYTEHSDAQFKYLLDSGFNIFCGVGMPPYLKVYDTYIFMDRQNIDGYSLGNYPSYLQPLMNSDSVLCPGERQ